jgi:hypothetical protein
MEYCGCSYEVRNEATYFPGVEKWRRMFLGDKK